MKNKINQIILALLVIGLYSCDKENYNVEEPSVAIEETSPISIKNGALQFSSTEVFTETIDELGEMNQDEFVSWELANGFKSLKTELDLAYEAMDLTENSIQLEDIIQDNKDILKVTGDVIEPIVESNTYSMITNRNGEFYIGDVLHKVSANKIAISLNGDVNALSNILKENTAISKSGKSSDKNLFVFEYTANEDKGSESARTLTDAVSNTLTNDKRRITLEMKAVAISGWGIYRYNGAIPSQVITTRSLKMETKASNFRKTWGKFRPYSNPCTIRNLSFELKNDRFRSWGSRSWSRTARTYTLTSTIFSNSQIFPYGEVWSAPGIDKPVILRASADATNQGIGNRWVQVRK